MHHRLHAAALSAALAILPLAALSELPPGAAAQIVSLQGQGDQRGTDAPDWQAARTQQTLAPGDYVRTRAQARMALLLADQTQLRLNQDSVLQVKALAAAGQGSTELRLEAGRAWTQTRRPGASTLLMHTPSATAAIRGTDWDISVAADGRTLLTVLSGTVELANAQGAVSIAANEAAVAEVGKAPVKLHLTNPRERVQWVNALQAEPLAHLRAAPPPDGLLPVLDALSRRDGAAASAALTQAGSGVSPAWRGSLHAAIALQDGQLAAARTRLQTLLQAGDAPPAAALMLADLQWMDGEHAAALQTLATALQRAPQHPALLAQRARVQLLADDLPAARATLSTAAAQNSVDLTLVRAALARREGDAPATLAAYVEATRQAPQDARGWLGLGSAQAEREDSTPARQHLQQALALDAHLPGAQGERGTLETYANRFPEAQAAFDAALQDNPADYVALTGLGLLHLKRGEPEAALDAFLRAGVMEPRYARAKTWTAVAYYQLGRRQDAIVTLEQAAQLDDKDPVPWMLLAQIHTDLFQLGEAVDAARAALTRMPYLKSLNQLANDQKGSANLGAALAFFGMEDWALELARESFSPYWGASHLFLADRYPGEFNKNSALFQGFLTDPMAFGASQRYSTLLQQPGSHGALGWRQEREFYHLAAPSATLNGMSNRQMPLSWFVKAQPVRGSGFPIDMAVVNFPATRVPNGGFDVDGKVVTLGLGAQPNERLKLFAYGNYFDIHMTGQNHLATTVAKRQAQGALGLSWRWGPAAQTWLTLGRSLDSVLSYAYPTVFNLPSAFGIVGTSVQADKSFNDLQLRHVFDASPDTRLSATLAQVREKQFGATAGYGLVSVALDDGSVVDDTLLFVGGNDIRRRQTVLTLDMNHRLSPRLSLDGALAWQQLRERIDGQNHTLLERFAEENRQDVRRHDTAAVLTPRLGLVWQPATGQTLRLAYQDWVRPLSTSTLASVQTAGIAVQDQLLQAGGRHKRLAVEWGQSLGPSTFVQLRADHLRLSNPGTLGVDLRTPSLPFLEELRNTQMVNLSGLDLLEDTPSYERGTLKVLGAGINHMFSRQWSGYAKYLHQHSEANYGAGEQRVAGLRIPYIARHTLALGSTWASSARWYVSARAVYRSQRFEDQENLTPRAAGWSLDAVAFWESEDKRWIAGFAALDLWRQSERQKPRFVFDARYRF